MTARTRVARRLAVLLALAFASMAVLLGLATPATAAPGPAASAPGVHTAATSGLKMAPDGPNAPKGPTAPKGPSGPKGDSSVTIDLDGITDKPSTSVTVIVAMTLLSLLPAILLTCTSFTKILVVLGLTRNALGLQQIPPNQVLAGLALFLSLFIMAPVMVSLPFKLLLFVLVDGWGLVITSLVSSYQ